MRHAKSFAYFIMLLVVTLQATVARAGEPDCIADWSEAAAIIKAEKLTTVDRLAEIAKSEHGGTIVKTTLCRFNSDYIYRLVVRLPSGKLNSVTVDAGVK